MIVLSLAVQFAFLRDFHQVILSLHGPEILHQTDAFFQEITVSVILVYVRWLEFFHQAQRPAVILPCKICGCRLKPDLWNKRGRRKLSYVASRPGLGSLLSEFYGTKQTIAFSLLVGSGRCAFLLTDLIGGFLEKGLRVLVYLVDV